MWTLRDRRIIGFLFPALLWLCASVVHADDLFHDRVAPLLEKKCLNCHNADDRKGEFVLETRDQLLSSGFVIPNNAEESRLLNVLVPESAGKRPAMPKEGTPLNSEEVGLMRDWIAAGASCDWAGRCGCTMNVPLLPALARLAWYAICSWL